MGLRAELSSQPGPVPEFRPAPVPDPHSTGTQKKKKMHLELYLLSHHYISDFEDDFLYPYFHPCKHSTGMLGECFVPFTHISCHGSHKFCLYFTVTKQHASVFLFY